MVSYYAVKFDFVDTVIARRPEADVAISFPSLVLRSVLRRVAKDRGSSRTKASYDSAHSSDLDRVVLLPR